MEIRQQNDLPLVSLIIVARNEVEYISSAVECLINQSYPDDRLEYIFADGCSYDGTREYLKEKVHALTDMGYRVSLLDNPKLILASGWNIAIREARGDIVCRIDAHSKVEKDYISTGVKTLMDNKHRKVVCVGGIISKNIGIDKFSQIVADLFSSRFGVGNSPFRNIQSKVIESDTAVFGLYWKSVFETVGFFNEKLERNQDIELHQQIRNKGMKFLSNPEMKIQYYVRNSLKKLITKAYGDGYWIIRSGSRLLRHWIPVFFVVYLCSLPMIVFLKVYWMFCPLALYLTLAIFFGLKDGSNIKSHIMLPFIFFVFHASYGLGTLWSLVGINNRRDSVENRV